MSQEQAADSSRNAVKQQIDADLLSEAEDVGVDVDSIVDSKLAKHEGYQPSTVARFVTSAIRNEVEAEQAEVLNGIIMGSRDRHGTNRPRNHSLVRSDSDHLEVSTWGGSIPGPSGDDVSIPIGGAAVSLRCSYQQEYDSYTAERLDSVTDFDHVDLVENLEKIAIDPSQIGHDDEYEVVVIRGEIRWINEQTVFDGDDQDDWYDGPVLMENASGELLPHMEISLQRDADTQVRCHLERMKSARRFIQMPDFEKLVHDAYREYDSPEDQTRFVTDGLQGREAVFIGAVTGYNTNRNDDGDVTNYVDIGLSAIVSTEGVEQASLAESATGEGDAEADAPADTAEAEGAPDAAEDTTDTEPAPAGASAESEDVEAAREQIEQYADLVGEDVESLTLEDIRDNVPGIDAPDVVVKTALGEYEDEDEADSDESDNSDEPAEPDLPFDPSDHTVDELRDAVEDVDDPDVLEELAAAEKAGKDRKSGKTAIARRMDKVQNGDDSSEESSDSDDPFALVEDDGEYHCPGEDGACDATAGSTGELVAHIFDEHGASGDPADWIAEHAEG